MAYFTMHLFRVLEKKGSFIFRKNYIMKRKYLSICLAAMLSLSLVACSSAEKTEGEAQTTQQEETMTDEEVVQVEDKADEIAEESVEMEKSVNELSNDVDSLLNDI